MDLLRTLGSVYSVWKSARTSSQRLKIGMLNRLRSWFSCQCVKSRTRYLLYAGKFAQNTLIRHVSILVHVSGDPLFTCLYLHVCVCVREYGDVSRLLCQMVSVQA